MTILRWTAIVIGGLASLLIVVGVIAVGLLFVQAKQKPEGRPQYVALGSSFAAGIGLGNRIKGSPIVCQRSDSGYPAQLARLRNLELVDMTCSGATTTHVGQGGQVFLGPQIDAVGPQTELVTLTAGGNDISYVGDLALGAGSRSKSIAGWFMRRIWSGPKAEGDRDYAKVHDDLVSTLREIRRRAPRARIVVLTYPQIVPPGDACTTLQLPQTEVDAMREVGDRLATVTRQAGSDAGVDVIDMQALGAAHHACSAEPWVNGWVDAKNTPFHPTLEGARAMAQAVNDLLDGKATAS
ncbi:Lipase 2 [Brevundimonas sp. NIBR10]|uniref:SGNH/GDSL hydrolase family protein n=1 Tax=Brevundimonas sp. NIBR10 TaxID=3015997 RepID=UPI0022F17D16|nr:SGNH/GDSL hydrolase family protein [Brevundimonas sp. NIBR10]WGM47448.1 Lipase 2 [Brevundimonas sp. NIBR10]